MRAPATQSKIDQRLMLMGQCFSLQNGSVCSSCGASGSFFELLYGGFCATGSFFVLGLGGPDV